MVLGVDKNVNKWLDKSLTDICLVKFKLKTDEGLINGGRIKGSEWWSEEIRREVKRKDLERKREKKSKMKRNNYNIL